MHFQRRKNGMQNEDLNNIDLPKKPESMFKVKRYMRRCKYKTSMKDWFHMEWYQVIFFAVLGANAFQDDGRTEVKMYASGSL